MNTQTQCTPSSLYSQRHRNPEISASWTSNHKQSITQSFKSRIINYTACAYCHPQRKRPSQSWKLLSVSRTKTHKCVSKLREEPVNLSKKKGTIAGAIALIIGTSIGSGILALPQKTSPAGLVPSSITMTICWAFLLIEALLLVEINVGLLREKTKKRVEEEEEHNGQLEVISIRTMAQETLGEGGGILATVTYVFMGYTSIVAYSSKSGEILNHLTNLPQSISGCFFTLIFTALISLGGTPATDRVNQWLTVSMIGLLLAIEIVAVVFGGWSGFEGPGDWGKVPATIPVIIFSLVYHDLAPFLCAYLGGDLQRIRASVLLGSVAPLVALLVWDAIVLGLSAHSDHVTDPVELLMSVRWNGVSIMVETFSLLAVGTSMIGTILGFSEFFKEQLFSLNSPSTRILQKPNERFRLGKWWGRNKVGFTATAMVIAPPLFVSATVPDAFSAATDIAGGYCMTMLYGVLPPTMAWAAMHNRPSEEKDEELAKKPDQKAMISAAKPAVLWVGLFACGIIVEQILHDFSILHF